MDARRLVRSFGLVVAALFVAAFGSAQQAPPEPAKPVAPPASVEPAPVSPPLEYLGRRIAPTMSFEGGPWLMRATREKEERCETLLEALHLKPGQVVADVGCGNGFYTFRLAERVGAKGKIYAVDVQPEMLALLAEQSKLRGDPKNIEAVLGTELDPKLPAGSLDLAFLVDVYHELSHPAEMLAALRKALKPTGRIVLVEFRLEDPEVPIKLLHKMTKAQMKKELAANDFVVDEEFDELPWQHVVFFKPSPPEKPPR